MVADLGLYVLEVPETAHPVDSYRPHQSTTTQPPPQATHSRGRLIRHCSPADPPQWSHPVLTTDQPRRIPPIDLPTAIKTHLQEEAVHSPHIGHISRNQLR